MDVYFHENLRQIRRNLGLTQLQMARLLRINHASLSKYEIDAFPQGKTLVKLVELYDLDLHALFFTQGYKNPAYEQMNVQKSQKIEEVHDSLAREIERLNAEINYIKSQLRIGQTGAASA